MRISQKSFPLLLWCLFLILVDSQSITLKIFPDQVDGISRCSNCSFVCSLQTTRFANYGTLRYKLWQFLVESASNADSGNVKRW